ncbi:glycosyltransferase family A protein [Aestuariibaculum sp. YM273]|uniref:glycosyltransferase family 2 protein n=1 Tax=Aestuariibaculum sp. YM273 TaxID=3070659 RepID=UPI0027DDA510|nr:glycosyltransferase family A protein [Aestuariibaculum sp. YM273]WMI65810.1 glycosyltransferase family A protein [Aestuariibaculum sp. YM273]
MIIIYHEHNKPIGIQDVEDRDIRFDENAYMSVVLFEIATKYPEEILVWCHRSYKSNLNISALSNMNANQTVLQSYSGGEWNYLGEAIGYVDESVFIKVNKGVKYPTWQMSSLVGAVQASLLLSVKNQIHHNKNFDYVLNSLAKRGMSQGVFCYSNPELIKGNLEVSHVKANAYELFRFVKQHYKAIWVFLLFMNLLVYEKRMPFLPCIYALFFRRRKDLKLENRSLQLDNQEPNVKNESVDVIIPTIGRKNYLYEVLYDLREQTWLPQKVIIVEQNPEEGSDSALDYLETEDWPFTIQHRFTHQTGACYARNWALEQVDSEWVFMADDDIRLKTEFIEEAFQIIKEHTLNVFTFACHSLEDINDLKNQKQWEAFGSGCSIIKPSVIKDCCFEMCYEHGFGEDADFGMQLRNIGEDILYVPEPHITHLKAPRGGFRTVFKQQWHDDAVQPKPSPTVMLFKLKHQTRTQLLGYKTTLFFKYYKQQSIKNPLKYFKNFKKQWDRSVYWAEELRSLN